MAIEESGNEAIVEHDTTCSGFEGGWVKEYAGRSIDSLEREE